MMREGDTTARTTNVGVVTVHDHGQVQIGDKYSIVNHYPDSSAQKEKARVEFLQRLHTSPYEERKIRNPKRADGTCEWFTAHRLFQNWQNETSALLWVSADPGCGKSVLARYLVEDVLPASATRTTCYFFFKDDFDDQKTLEGALRCILHQLFVQNPALLSDDILKDFRQEGDQLFASFKKLWDIFIRAACSHKDGEIICVLDALDECQGPTRLGAALTQIYSDSKGTATLKILVTSRPYLQIQREFQSLEETRPTIHLSGESQEEVDKIALEITIAIRQRTEELCKRLQLTIEEKQILQEGLAAVNHRTYLWVHLVFADMEEAVFLNKDEWRASIRNLPHTVDEAYDRILRKSKNSGNARKILHVVVAAERPLHLKEMAAVLAFRKESHRCHGDLDRDLLELPRLHTMIREACGLFVVIQDSQVFLLHQTAREFLVQLPPVPSEARPPPLEWHHSVDPQESHRLLSDVCIGYLLFTDFENEEIVSTIVEYLENVKKSQVINYAPTYIFLNYAASNWADHYRQAQNTIGTGLERSALRLCRTTSSTGQYWLRIYGDKRLRNQYFVYELCTSLLVASYFGLDDLVKLILREKNKDLSARGDTSYRTALSWASERGYHSIVQSLLDEVPKGLVLLKDWTSSPTIVNRSDRLGRTPLWYAAANGHRSIAQLLLKRGAKVDAPDEVGLTPLKWAIYYGHSDIVALLLKHRARGSSMAIQMETRDRQGLTPLIKASVEGDEDIVRILLDQGVKIEAVDAFGRTALICASLRGHYATVKLLLDRGANIEASDEFGLTTLAHAVSNGSGAVVKLLVDRGAEVEASSSMGRTALIHAAYNGRDTLVKLLLDRRANIEASDTDGKTPLMHALANYRHTTGELLLDEGAKMDASDANGRTALIQASILGSTTGIDILLDRGANIEALDLKGLTALMHASLQGYTDAVMRLLDRGANIQAVDGDGRTALIYATSQGHNTTAKLLQDRGASLPPQITGDNGI